MKRPLELIENNDPILEAFLEGKLARLNGDPCPYVASDHERETSSQDELYAAWHEGFNRED